MALFFDLTVSSILSFLLPTNSFGKIIVIEALLLSNLTHTFDTISFPCFKGLCAQPNLSLSKSHHF